MAAFSMKDIKPSPIEEGDAGIILKANGGFQVFNTHKNLDGVNLTGMQREQAQKLIALILPLRFPEFMDILIKASEDPTLAIRLEPTVRQEAD